MATKVAAPALPSSIKTGMSGSEGKSAMGTPASDAEVMSRLSASSGLDKIRAGTPKADDVAPEPPPEPAPEAEQPETPIADVPVEPEGTAPESFDLPDESPAEPEPEQEAEAPATEDEPSEEPAEKKPTGKDLRSQLEHFSTQAKALSKEKEALSKRISELENQVKDAPNSKALSETLAEREKTIGELNKKLSYLDYTQSTEFQEKFRKPYQTKLNEAYKELTTLQKGDGSTLDQQTIESIILTDEKSAYRAIERELEGADARLANRLVAEVYALQRDQQRALKQAETEAEQHRTKQAALRTQFREQFKAKVTDLRNQIKEKYPDLYNPDPKDPQRAQLFEAGYGLVEAAFDKIDSFDPDTRAKIEAEIYHRAGAFPALRLRAVRAEKELAALKQELSKFKSNSPGRGQPPEDAAGGRSAKQPEIGSQEWIAQGLRTVQRTVKP